MISRKSEGLHEEEWMKCVQERYEERQRLFPLEPKQLKWLYDQNIA